MKTGKASVIYLILSFFIFCLLVLRTILVPLCHDHMATFVLYVQNGEFYPYFSNTDGNNHFLNSFLSYYSYQLFGFSSLVLRLPNLISFLIFSYAGFEFIKLLKTEKAKWVFTGLILFSFYWISFFEIALSAMMSHLVVHLPEPKE